MKDYYSRDKDDAYRQQRQSRQNPPEPEAKPPKKHFPWGKLVIILVILLVIFVHCQYKYVTGEEQETQEKPMPTELPVTSENAQPEEK